MKLREFGDAMPLLCVSALSFTGARRTGQSSTGVVLLTDHCAVCKLSRRKGQHHGPASLQAWQA